MLYTFKGKIISRKKWRNWVIMIFADVRGMLFKASYTWCFPVVSAVPDGWILDYREDTWRLIYFPLNRHRPNIDRLTHINLKQRVVMITICCHSLKRKCFDEIFFTGCSWHCQNDNIRCIQWWKVRQNDTSVGVSASGTRGCRYDHLRSGQFNPRF